MPNTTTHLLTSSPSRGVGSGATAQTLLRRVVLLTAGYLAISLASVAAIALRVFGHAATSGSVQIHGIVVAATAIGSLTGAILAGRGSRAAFTRLRGSSVVLVVAV